MSINIDLQIYSPRWGRNDTYSIELDRDFMEITLQARKARASWRSDLDPEWSGGAIQKIMNNDGIYPPEITQDLLVRAWLEWRDGGLNDQQVEEELQNVATWINAVTNSKPKSDFWAKYF